MNWCEWFFGIMASLIVVFMSQLINYLIFEPRNTFKRLRNKISAALIMYARYTHNPGDIRIELEEETDNAIRVLASELNAFSSEYITKTFCHVNMKDAVEASGKLIGLANGVYDKGNLKDNEQLETEIKQLLQIKDTNK